MAKVPFWKRKGKGPEAAAGSVEGLPEDLSDNLELDPDEAGDSGRNTESDQIQSDQFGETASFESGHEVSQKTHQRSEGDGELDLNGFEEPSSDPDDQAFQGDDESPVVEPAAEVVSDDPIAMISAEYELEIKRLQVEIRENYDKYLRALAEGENIKKRALKERAEVLKYAGEGLARDILEVIDDMENAVGQAGNVSNYSKESLDSVITGFKLVFDKFKLILDRHSIKGESAVGQMLDPKRHEALAAVPTADVPPGQIINEFRKPYFFKDKLLRPGQVVVASAPPIAASEKPPADSTDAEIEDNGDDKLSDG